MADAATTIFAMVKPEVGASADTWGSKLNTNFDDIDALAGAIITTGSANAYVLTSGLSLAAYVTGQRFLIKTNFANTGAATINVDSLGAKNLTKNGTTALASGDLANGVYYFIVYDGTQFQIVGALNNTVQPLDATLTALAALSWSSGNALVQFTAADTVSLTLTPSVTSVTSGSVLASSNDSGALGASGTAFSDLFLASGGVINWGNGNVTLTHSSGALTLNADEVISKSSPTSQLHDTSSNSRWNCSNVSGSFYLGKQSVVDALVISSTLAAFGLPIQARTALSSETSGTLTAASANKRVKATAGVTINDGVFTAEDAIEIYNDSDSSITLTQDTGMTLRLAGTTSTGNRTLAARTIAYVYFDTNADAAVAGSGVS